MGIMAVNKFSNFNTGHSNKIETAVCESTATAYYVTTEGIALGISVPVVATIAT
jgi:hypothetical protein